MDCRTEDNNQEIQHRIFLTMKCLEEIDLIKAQSLETRAKIHEKLVKSAFDDVRFQLNLLEKQLINKVNKQLFQKQVDLALNSLEYEMRQLILQLSASIHTLSDEAKPIVLRDADAQIKTLVSKLTEIERYNKIQEDQIGNKSLLDKLSNGLVPFLDKLKNSIVEQSPAIVRNFSTQTEEKKDLNNNSTNKEDSIHEWLLSSDNSIVTITDQSDASSSVATLTNDQAENERSSFDFVDFCSELDSIEVITEFDETQSQKQSSDDESEKRETTLVEEAVTDEEPKCDGFSKTINEIYSRPMSYWLLQPRVVN